MKTLRSLFHNLSFLSFGVLAIGVGTAGWGDHTVAQIIAPTVAPTVVIDGVSVQTSSGFSFSYTEPRVVPGYSYVAPVYVAPSYGVPGYGQPIYRPGIVSPPTRNLTIVNPTVISTPVYPTYPIYPAYPYSVYPPIYNSVQTINRPSPEIIVDPQYGVRFKNPPGY